MAHCFDRSIQSHNSWATQPGSDSPHWLTAIGRDEIGDGHSRALSTRSLHIESSRLAIDVHYLVRQECDHGYVDISD